MDSVFKLWSNFAELSLHPRSIFLLEIGFVQAEPGEYVVDRLVVLLKPLFKLGILLC